MIRKTISYSKTTKMLRYFYRKVSNPSISNLIGNAEKEWAYMDDQTTLLKQG